MFDLIVPAEIQEYSRHLVAKRNMGQRKAGANGDINQQWCGVCGECVISDLLGQPRPNGNGPDGGHDVVIGDYLVDVKTMGRRVPMLSSYVNNYIDFQRRLLCDALLFCSFNVDTDILTVCGWIDKADLPKVGKLYRAGTERKRRDGTTFTLKADNWEIPQSRVIPLHEPRDLRGIGA